MKVYISHSPEDKRYAAIIADRLRAADHHVRCVAWTLRVGDNLLEKINQGLKDTDALVVIVSKHSLRSKWVMHEFSAIALGDLSSKSCRIIPVLVDNSSVPQYLARYVYVDLTNNPECGLRQLLLALSQKPEMRPPVKPEKRSYDAAIRSLADALDGGRLTLVCGAGVSMGAGIPSWNMLLQWLLARMMKRISQDHSFVVDDLTSNEFHKRYAPSALVLGKYLKANLGKEFLPELRDALYAEDPTSCDIIEAIAELARPQRDGRPLESIITFNFDGPIEECLERSHIRYKSVFAEGIRCRAKELPIYHVHGFLPRKGKIGKDVDVVFSEDAYHTQFIEPFSWSNLIQLNKLSQNICLFIGLSLTDPNLRRLLDVANRRNPLRSLDHFLVKKVPNVSRHGDTADQLAFLLEEQDANDLGLNVVWIDEFSEVAPILRKIVGDGA
jgi:hypothetical protein